ncbi:MAG: proline dehydrogenase family protein, partial [Chloroflexota bacterium]|nr:proline dehydrogenase family protein [Chloroflexota bacterium]
MFIRNTMLWLAGNEAVKRMVMRSRLSLALAHRFVAGETAEQALEAARTLNHRGALVSLDYLGENITTETEARAVATTYRDLLRAIAERQLNCNVSLKLTALGLDIDRELCAQNMRDVLDTARETSNFVRIDMEGSAYTQVT